MPRELPETSVITPDATLSFPHLFEVWRGPTGDQPPKYSAVLIFSSGTDLMELKRAVIHVAKKKYGDKAEAMIRDGSLRMPFRSDPADVEKKGYPKGSTFIQPRSDNPPGVVSRFAGEDGKPITITKEEQKTGNPNELYSGCLVRALLSAYAYDRSGNKGITFGLNGIQKMGEGERLDNRVVASEAFEADMAEEPASMGDLLEGM